MSIKAEMVQQGGSDFWVVSCISSGGRPDTDISLALNTEELEKEDDTDSQTQAISYRLPVMVFEGHNITCMFDHPKFTHRESQVITLPSLCGYYHRIIRKSDLILMRSKLQKTKMFFFSADLSRVQLSAELRRNNYPDQIIETLELQEGESDTIIGLEVIGNVPRYNTTCKK